MAGGLFGQMIHGLLHVQLLALGEARGHGLGREVMALAEREARAAGMRGMRLDTFTFQAPEFYRKLGFEEFGRIGEYPAGHARVFFVKRWDGMG